MKRILAILAVALAGIFAAGAQDADRIVGEYITGHAGTSSKVRIYKASDGTYTGQVFWVKDRLDGNGKVFLDKKNPDKSLRGTPVDKVKVLWGLRYNAGKGRWDSGKVYDPSRGIKANATASFSEDGRLKIKGSLVGISETVYWKRID